MKEPQIILSQYQRFIEGMMMTLVAVTLVGIFLKVLIL